jgi:hypothetical protein
MDDDSKILFFRQPDPLERKVRLACGGLLGLGVGLVAWLWYGLSPMGGILLTLVLVVLCANFALKYGDSFWHEALRAMRWL